MSSRSLDLAIKCTTEEGEPSDEQTYYRLAEMYTEKARRLERSNHAGQPDSQAGDPRAVHG